jgi:hypothetical protein
MKIIRAAIYIFAIIAIFIAYCLLCMCGSFIAVAVAPNQDWGQSGLQAIWPGFAISTTIFAVAAFVISRFARDRRRKSL